LRGHVGDPEAGHRPPADQGRPQAEVTAPRTHIPKETHMALLEGRTAVITGAAQGLGLAIAEALVAEGANVVLGDLNEEAVIEAAKNLGVGDRAIGMRCNVVELEEVDALAQRAVEVFGGLDVMVNNAGITRDATMR